MGRRGTSTADGESEIFYAGDGVVASTYPGWLKSAFVLLTGVFDRVGLRTNSCKTVGLVCRPFWAAGVRADEAYTRRMTGEGRCFKEQQRGRVSCPEYGKELAKGSMVTHCQNQHGVSKWRLG